MKTLIQTTFPILVLMAIPIMFYAGIVLGSKISNTNKSVTNTSIEHVFEFVEEPYIDDIPFNTECIAKQWNDCQSVIEETNFLGTTTLTEYQFNTNHLTIGVNENLVASTASF